MAYLPGLIISRSESGLNISGKTFDYKDKIKSIAGARWNSELKCWSLPSETNLSAIRSNKSCCSQCLSELDNDDPRGPMWFVCPLHGKWKDTYTGD